MKARIVYMGTPEFAVAPLEALIESQHEVVAVVTVPDRQAGRGRKPTPSAVKVCAEKHNLPILQPEKLRDEAFQEELASFNADLFIVVAFRMLPVSVWSMPKLGTFNLHASLLPDYRGAAPIHWAVINGEAKTGVTTFLIDEEIDTGNILLQAETTVGENETTGELYHRLMELGSPLVVQTVDGLLNGELEGKTQKHVDSPKSAPKLFREHQYVPLNGDAASAHNRVRGLSPFPAPLLVLETKVGERIEAKVANSGFEEGHIGECGTIEWRKNEMAIQCENGLLILREIQWPGKKKMGVADFKNGYGEYSELKALCTP